MISYDTQGETDFKECELQQLGLGPHVVHGGARTPVVALHVST